jgi:pectate lyase
VGGMPVPTFAKMGWVNSNNVTGGAGGPTVVVSNYYTLSALVRDPSPVTIYIKGTITNPATAGGIEPYIYVTGNNKSILGYGTNATLWGCNLRLNSTNLIVRNLFMPVPPYGTNDALLADGGGEGTNRFAWVDHCTFYNAQDGSFDVAKDADYVTVSWCKFVYSVTDNPKATHRLVNLIGSSDSDTNVNFHVTFHHNWYGTNCMERMPSVRAGRVHVFNNYYGCTSNNYCIRTRLYAQVLAENNYFDHVNDPFEQYVGVNTAVEPVTAHGLLKQTGNVLSGCTSNYNYILTDSNPVSGVTSNASSITFTQSGKVYTIYNTIAGNDTLPDMNLTPTNSVSSAYWYALDSATNLPSLISTYAGHEGAILPLH